MRLLRRNQQHDQESNTSESATATADTAIAFGVPGLCPRCGAFGYIDLIDVINSFQTQHCPDCQHQWEYQFDADGALISTASADEGEREDRVIDIRPSLLGKTWLTGSSDTT